MLGQRLAKATLKNEMAHRMVYPTKDKAIKDIASWIELRYSRTRLHLALGDRTPDEVKSDFLDLTNAARKTNKHCPKSAQQSSVG